MSMFAESIRAFLKPVLVYLDDEQVTEILINGPEDVWIERNGKLERTNAKFTAEGLLGAVRNMAQYVGRPLSEERPRMDARLPDGSRIHAVVPPVARAGAVVAIRKFFREKLAIESLVSFGALSSPMARLLEVAIGCKLNTVVAGGTSSGKTTLLNVMASFIPAHERVLVLEDSSELRMNQPHVVSLEARPADKSGKGAVDMGELLHSALRLRPDRIVVGEVRGGEAFYLVQAMNTGHGGSLATTHANTPSDTLRRIESLCLMGVVDLPMVAVRAQVASAIHLVVTCGRLADGSRKLTSIAEVLPLSEHGEYRTQELFVFTPVARGPKGEVLGYHGPTGLVPRFLPRAVSYGFDIDETFFDPRTYGLPPPPLDLFAVQTEPRWAPSLKHRERHEKDPSQLADEYGAFAAQLSIPKADPKPPATMAEPPPPPPQQPPPPPADPKPDLKAPRVLPPLEPRPRGVILGQETRSQRRPPPPGGRGVQTLPPEPRTPIATSPLAKDPDLPPGANTLPERHLRASVRGSASTNTELRRALTLPENSRARLEDTDGGMDQTVVRNPEAGPDDG